MMGVNAMNNCVGGGMMMSGMMMFWLFVLAAGFLVIFLILNRRRDQLQPAVILKERLAKGEIAEEEYDRLREKLK